MPYGALAVSGHCCKLDAGSEGIKESMQQSRLSVLSYRGQLEACLTPQLLQLAEQHLWPLGKPQCRAMRRSSKAPGSGRETDSKWHAGTDRCHGIAAPL